MPYPPAIILRPCTVGGSTALESGTQLVLSAEITASRSLKWGATGWQFPSLTRTVTGTEGAELSFSLPVTDLAGWRLNDDSGSIIDVSTPGSYTHTYTIKLKTLSGGRQISERTIGPFVLPTEDGSPIDLDLMLPAATIAGGVVLVPDSWDTRVAAAEAAAVSAAGDLSDAQGVLSEIVTLREHLSYKQPIGVLAFAAANTARSSYPLGTRTGATPVGTAYAIDHGWVSRTTDGWVNKTNGISTSEVSGWTHGQVNRLVAWSDGSLCLVTPTKVVTMASISTPAVVTLTAEYAFGGLPVHFYEAGATRIVIIGEYNQANDLAKKLYLSRDGGATFTVIKTTGTGAPVNNHWHACAYDPWSNAIWAASGDDSQPPRGIFYSKDWGVTWDQMTADDGRHIQPTLIVPFPGRVVFGRDAGLIAPGLDAWQRPLNAQPVGDQPVTLGALEFAQHLSASAVYPEERTTCIGRTSSEVYVAFPRRATGYTYIWATGDGGASWHLVSTTTASGYLQSDGQKIHMATTLGSSTLQSAPLLDWEWTPA